MYEITVQKKTYQVPASVADVSIGRFIEFRNLDPNNVLDLVYWLLNDKPTFSSDVKIETEIANLLTLTQPVIDDIYAFFNNKSKHDVPKEIEVLGETLKIKDGLLNDLPYWPYVVTKAIVMNAVEKKNFDPTDDIPRVLAHYLYNYSTKLPYNEKDAEGFIYVVNDIPMTPAIQLGNFFLSKHQNLFPRNKRPSKLKLIRNMLKPA